MVPNNYAAQDGGVRIDEGSENCFKIVNQNGIDLCGVFVLLIEPAVDRWVILITARSVNCDLESGSLFSNIKILNYA